MSRGQAKPKSKWMTGKPTEGGKKGGASRIRRYPEVGDLRVLTKTSRPLEPVELLTFVVKTRSWTKDRESTGLFGALPFRDSLGPFAASRRPSFPRYPNFFSVLFAFLFFFPWIPFSLVFSTPKRDKNRERVGQKRKRK